jgi:hypothetical protein
MQHTHGKYEKCTQTFHRKRWRERSHDIPRYRWDNNINMDLGGTGCEDMSWICLSQDRIQ